MKVVLGFAAPLLLVVAISEAHAQPCPGPTRTLTGANGVTKTICLDGKYSTCMRDSMAFGNSKARAKAYCDARKAAGAVK